MAWVFSLSIECGSNKEAAEAVVRHFEGFSVTISDGSRFPCIVRTFFDEEGWWVSICPDGVSKRGIENENDARQMTESSFVLYDQLRSAPSYRYALVGVEAEGFRSFSELNVDVITGDFDGLVLADSIWQGLGCPSTFVPFVSGYHWNPFTPFGYSNHVP